VAGRANSGNLNLPDPALFQDQPVRSPQVKLYSRSAVLRMRSQKFAGILAKCLPYLCGNFWAYLVMVRANRGANPGQQILRIGSIPALHGFYGCTGCAPDRALPSGVHQPNYTPDRVE
jgi:hypothetical protein